MRHGQKHRCGQRAERKQTMSARGASNAPPKVARHYSRNQPCAHPVRAFERRVSRREHNVTPLVEPWHLHHPLQPSKARCGAMIVGDRMPAMAVFRSAILDARRDVARRLMVALAVFCLLTMSAHAQTAGAAPTPPAAAAQAPAGNSAFAPSCRPVLAPPRRAASEPHRRSERARSS